MPGPSANKRRSAEPQQGLSSPYGGALGGALSNSHIGLPGGSLGGGARSRLVRNFNSIVRKHKKTHKRRRALAAAIDRTAIESQTGIAEVGSEIAIGS